MSEKKPTVSALLRKVAKLEARLAVAESRLELHFEAYRENLYEEVDAKTRIDQAMAILKGEE